MSKKDVTILIEESLFDNRTSLDLSDNQLTELPPEIGQLKNLRRLALNFNQLTQLPPEIGQLKDLQELDVYNNQLTQLPPEIGLLRNLQAFYLRYNRLTQLPPEIGQLKNLQFFFVRTNQLTQLPPEIGQLRNLQELDIDNNQLTELPPEIGQLTNLKILYVDNNQLTELPPEIGLLRKLWRLDLRGNQLTEIPLEISQLRNLQVLYVDNNQLTQLPPEIGLLRNLQELDVYNNQLTQLPPEIGQLRNLQRLALSDNQLTEEILLAKNQGIDGLRHYLLRKAPRSVLRLHTEGDISVQELRAYLAAIEHAYNSIYVFEEIVENVRNRQEQGELEMRDIEWPTTQEKIAARVPLENQLRLHKAKLGSLGFIKIATVAGALVPLFMWITDEVRRRRDYWSKKTQEAREDKSQEVEMELKNNQLEEYIIRSVKLLSQAEIPLKKINQIKNELIETPLKSIAPFIDNKTLVDAEIEMMEDLTYERNDC